jgi:hypothetical protein
MSWLSDLFGGDSPERPAYPIYDTSNLQPLIDEYLNLARGGIGKTLSEPPEYSLISQQLQNLLGFQPSVTQITAPQEYGMASQTLQDILGLQPQAFQFPMEDIQKALSAQQGIQLNDYLKQIRPVLAQQGQLDSSYYTNLLGDFLQQQQAQTYGTTADLLTQQAQQNLALQQYFPQLKTSAAGQLAGIGTQQADIQRLNAQLQYLLPQYQSGILNQLQGIGGARSGIEQYNMQYPYQTYLPALQSGYGIQKGLQDSLFQQALGAQQQEMGAYNQAKESYDATRAMLWQAGLGALTGGLGAIPGLAGGLGGALTGGLGGFTGTLGSMVGGGLQQSNSLSSLLGKLGNTSSSMPDYNSLLNYQSMYTQQPNLKSGGQTIGSLYYPQWSLQ